MHTVQVESEVSSNAFRALLMKGSEKYFNMKFEINLKVT